MIEDYTDDTEILGVNFRGHPMISAYSGHIGLVEYRVVLWKTATGYRASIGYVDDPTLRYISDPEALGKQQWIYSAWVARRGDPIGFKEACIHFPTLASQISEKEWET